MPAFTIAAYNIEQMNRMFTGNVLKPEQEVRAQAIAAVIDRLDPHILAVSEAANRDEEHEDFIARFLGGRFRVASGASRGGQNLVYYYRDPVVLESIDQGFDFYQPFNVDVDDDGVTERIRWERKPLEAVFRLGDGPNAASLRTILVHTKSKGVFDVVDLAGFDKVSRGNRKKLLAQAARLRERVDVFLTEDPRVPTVVLGDLNDGPGIEPFEQFLGRSFVETLMGSVFEPRTVLHNAQMDVPANRRYTADFEDPIVNNPLGRRHKVWIDHILLSPDVLEPANPVRLVPGSGVIDAQDSLARAASDHFAVACRLEA